MTDKTSGQNRYDFKPYDPIFPALFIEEKERLEKFFAFSHHIEHFGSTAVEGLGGKGYIDMYVLVHQENMQTAREFLEIAGYDWVLNDSTTERWFFFREFCVSGSCLRRYHTHLTFPENPDVKKDLAFRDYLMNHPEATRVYSLSKQQASENAKQSFTQASKIYMQGKSQVIQDILLVIQKEEELVKKKTKYLFLQ